MADYEFYDDESEDPGARIDEITSATDYGLTLIEEKSSGYDSGYYTAVEAPASSQSPSAATFFALKLNSTALAALPDGATISRVEVTLIAESGSGGAWGDASKPYMLPDVIFIDDSGATHAGSVSPGDYVDSEINWVNKNGVSTYTRTVGIDVEDISPTALGIGIVAPNTAESYYTMIGKLGLNAAVAAFWQDFVGTREVA